MSKKSQRWRPDGWDEAKQHLLANWKWDGQRDSLYSLAERVASKMLDTIRKQGIETSCSRWPCTDEEPCGACPIGRTIPSPDPHPDWPGRMVFIPDDGWQPPKGPARAGQHKKEGKRHGST